MKMSGRLPAPSATTALSTPSPAEFRLIGGRRRWVVCAMAVLALHAAILATALSWQPAGETPRLAPPAMTVDLMAPEPAAPPQPEKAPDVPAPQAKAPQAKMPAEIPQPKPLPSRVAAKPAAYAPDRASLPSPASLPPSADIGRPAEVRAGSAAPQEPARVAAEAAAAQTAAHAAVAASWQSQLLAQLERYKRYPVSARARHQQGTAVVRFVMKRDGSVLSARLNTESGSPMLDQEALDLPERAQPLPPPPPEVTGDRIELVVPVRFSLD